MTRPVVSKIDYSSSILASMSGRLLSRLQSVLNAAARLVFSARKSDHVLPPLHELHWLRVPGEDPVPATCFGVGYRCLHGIAPTYLADSFRRTDDVDGRRRLYALPSQTRWSWHRRTVQHSATVLSQWLHQKSGMACLLQSEPLRHCRRFVRN